jgi:hypothetical protein
MGALQSGERGKAVVGAAAGRCTNVRLDMRLEE